MSARAQLESLIARQDLGWQEAQGLMRYIMSGDADDAWIAGALIALRMKGVTGTELAAFADVMRDHALSLGQTHPHLVDTCGTGGGRSTFNLSTGAAIVAAAAGAKVAKHGNRAVTSSCGSADVLEALGVVLLADPEQLQHMLDSVGIVFLFAQHHHPAMRHLGSARKALGVRTVFNQLGPLANPAGAKRQLIGVYDLALVRPMAEALDQLACERALVVYGEDGMDEISPCATTHFIEVKGANLTEGRFSPEDFGATALPSNALIGGSTPLENGAILRRALSDSESPQAAALIPNAAAALYLADMGDLKSCADLARATIASGAAIHKLDDLIEVTRAL
jgi:anthranilate phosphoribosyltransferase